MSCTLQCIRQYDQFYSYNEKWKYTTSIRAATGTTSSIRSHCRSRRLLDVVLEFKWIPLREQR